MKKIIKQRYSYRRKKHMEEYLTTMENMIKLVKGMLRKDLAEELKRIRKEDA